LIFLECQGQYDLTFLVDSSSDVGEENFNLAKQFVVDIVDAFDVNVPNTHIAVISYDSTPKVEITFNKYPRVDKERIKAAISGLDYRGKGPSSTADALQQAIDVVYNPANGAREGVNKVRTQGIFKLNCRFFLYFPIHLGLTFIVFSVSSDCQSRNI